jgi:tetratricopeptide (TPR) repeat protein/tRNA A-37 threonylcarbamoyl transferase component Bud32
MKKWKRSRKLIKHHITNRCRGGKTEPSNLLLFDSERERAWHFLFGNKNFVGKVLDGRYQVIQELGSGGFGDTYLAKDMRSPNKLQRVIKHFKPKESPNGYMLQKLREKFEDEKKTLERLGEKNDQIPSLVDNFTWKNQFFYVQEFVDGHTLNDEIYDKEVDLRTNEVKFRPKTLSEAQVRSLLIDILEVMAFVHENKIIHRDLKPANIMRRDDDQKIVIIDFGAVKQLHSITENPQTRKSSVGIYTQGYAPAEQLNGNPFYASDVYAIGVIGIQALTGISPDRTPKDENLELDWQPPNSISSEFLAVLKKMVRYDFKQRYTNAREALVAIRNLPNLPFPSQSSSLFTTIPTFGKSGLNLPTPSSVSVSPNLSGNPSQPKSGDNRSDKTVVYRADPSNINLFKLIGGFLLVILIGGGVYIWQNPKRLSSLRLPWSKSNLPINDTKAATLYVQGQEKYYKNDYKGAIADFTEVILLVPDYTEAYVFRGLAKNNSGDKKGAVVDYNEAIRLKPDYALAYYNRGNTKDGLEDKKGALSDYNEAIRLMPDYVEAYVGRGNIKDALEDKKGAIADYTEAIRIKPDYALAYSNRGVTKNDLGDKKGAIADYTEAIRIKPDYALAYSNRAYVKDDLGDKKGAIADYTEAIRLKPDYAYAYSSRGNAKRDLGDKKGAIADYTEAIRIKPDYDSAYSSRGGVKRDLGDKNGAIADYTEAIRFKPDYAYAYSSRGYVRNQLGDKKAAITDYSEAIRLKPNYAYAYYNRGKAKRDLGDNQGAIADYNESIRLGSKDVYTDYSSRGDAKRDLGDKKGAIADYTEAIRIKPDYAYAYSSRGYVKNQLGDNQGAITDYNESIRLKPNDASNYSSRGYAKSELEDYQGALADWNEAIRIKPNYASAYNRRGLMKLRLKDYQGGITDLNESIRLDPNEARAYASRGIIKRESGDNEGARVDLQKAAELFKKQGDTEKYNIAIKLIDEL